MKSRPFDLDLHFGWENWLQGHPKIAA